MLSSGKWRRDEFDRFTGYRRLSLKELHFCSPSFSHFGEDRMVFSVLDEMTDGFFVDVGAFHPYKLSNTHLLRMHGWTGVNIEPNPKNFPLFEEECPNDINLNMAISAKHGSVDFMCNGVLSGIVDESYLNNDSSPDGVEIPQVVTVATQPLSVVLENHLPKGREIDLLSVDCEGHDLAVLKSNDWNRFKPRVVVVEIHEQDTASSPVFLELVKHNYQYYCRVGLSVLFVDHDLATRLIPST